MGTLLTFLTPPASQNVHVQVSSELPFLWPKQEVPFFITMVWYWQLLETAIFGKYGVFHCDVEAVFGTVSAKTQDWNENVYPFLD